jgi:hypothetical protein
MATLDSRYVINGLIDTAGTALDNMTAITNSCNTWLSYDALVGQWSVVINRAGNAAISFNDSNIIGPINLTTTELTGYYNSCEVRFHNFDLRDREDYVLLEIPTNQRLPNEPDNRLIINAPMVNNQIQAQLIGLIELKQSRLDEIIEFTTDFSYINIEAGTIISVTNTVYGWTDKLFRVLTMTEQQSGDTIAIQITAQEYDANIYSDADLYLYLRDAEDGLIELDPLVDVSPVTASSAVVNTATGQVEPLQYTLPLLMTLLSAVNAGTGNQLTTGVFNGFQQQTGKDLITAQVSYSFTSTLSGASVAAKLAAQSAGSDGYLIYNDANTTNLANSISYFFGIPAGWNNVDFEIQTPTCSMNYWALTTAGEVLFTGTYAQPAFTVQIRRGATLASSTVVAESTVDWTTNYSKLVVPNPVPDTYWVRLYIIPTYDLNQYWPVRGGRSVAGNYVYFNNFASVGPATVTATVSVQ